ncbi:1-acyl-sn-glycerol-3-phosphate acyltransferase [Leucobacter sp. OH2974_COT-288]|uniref:1-acyl-sn-glycerol-3-phosphate acyltransferase n=1 Tax=Canibacter oris TaxID=1365628 RepID=A0A840DE28_9MICO|nr:lysophospholipid acyltransferase family protein [Canibacter oris]MBB4071314.1 1-acyl-sn-glycerol-3-phosphate acyltransferase [Canibacter oris]RRD36030.1 1-acyl-sn-glycerol-3-phosphate acyltransferase [Leucobacter sp. OH2974_COT-288]
MLYWILKHIVLGPLLKTIYRPWVEGAENIPAQGPVIIVGNHLSVIDSFFLPLMIDRRVYFLAKSDYFTGKGLKGAFVRNFMLGVGQLPIDRSGGKASEASLLAGLKVLGEGKVLGIYPEGTRSPDGKLYRGRTGIARLILESGAVVVPAIMVDTNKANPIGTRIPRLHRIGTIIGEPLDFSRFREMAADRFVLRSITDEIMFEIQKISQQQYVDNYASTVKARLEKEAKQEQRA